MRLKNNPSGCVDECKRGNRTCIECYYSQVNERNQWTGSVCGGHKFDNRVRELGVEVDG